MDVADDLLDGEHDPKAGPINQHQPHDEGVQAEDERPILSPKPFGPHPPAQQQQYVTTLRMMDCRSGSLTDTRGTEAYPGGLWLHCFLRSSLRKYHVKASAGKMKAMQGLVRAPISAFKVP